MRIPFDRLRPQKTGWGKRGLDEKGAKIGKELLLRG